MERPNPGGWEREGCEMILHDVLWALGDFTPFVVEAKLQDESFVRVFPVGFKMMTKDFMKFMSVNKENLRKSRKGAPAGRYIYDN